MAFVNSQFKNRTEAGEVLGKRLQRYDLKDPVVLALPRGGVPVASEIAKLLSAPLDVFIVRKIGSPAQPELAIGAIAEDDTVWWNENILSHLNYSDKMLEKLLTKERIKIVHQKKLFRGNHTLQSVLDRNVILVDDGLATGATAQAAINALKRLGAKRIIVAVPVTATSSANRLRESGVDVDAALDTENFFGVSAWYEDFPQVEDNEVLMHLREAQRRFSGNPSKVLPFGTKERTIIRAIADRLHPLKSEEDAQPLLQFLRKKEVVMLGEATHGTSEFYRLRDRISRELLDENGFSFVAVEGDWPPLFQLNSYIRNGSGKSSREIMKTFHRWPTWMWANSETADFVEAVRRKGSFGFYGLDIYSLFESIDCVLDLLRDKNPLLAQKMQKQYSCFEPFAKNEFAYARSLIRNPEGCTKEALAAMEQLLQLRLKDASQEELFFNAEQNARVIVNAENYYRTMMKGDALSWNIRDGHMLDTLEALLEHATIQGKKRKAIVWAHNTHVGDYRATDMAKSGYVNLGGLGRQTYGENAVALVGFGTYRGDVVAGKAWGAPEEIMELPPARENSYEFFFHEACKLRGLSQAYLLMNEGDIDGELAAIYGHRAVGVVYNPEHEGRGNYAPTSLSKRYDAFIFVDKSSALHSLNEPYLYGEFPEAWPVGM